LKVDSLRASVNAIVHRHECLRTRFCGFEGDYRQYVDRDGDCHFRFIDLSRLPAANVDQASKHQAREFLDSEVDLFCGPVFEARLWKLSEQEHQLIVLIDHIVSDGISNGILVNELWTLYGQSARGLPLCLPPLSAQFFDYALWQHRTRDSWMREHAHCWEQHLVGVPQAEIPTAISTGDKSQSIATTTLVHFDDLLSVKLRDIARRERLLPSVVVLCVYAVAMSHWCGQKDLLMPLAHHGRDEFPELQHMIGSISSNLYLRLRLTDCESFRELLQKVTLELAFALEHRDFDRVPGFVPGCISDVAFNWQPVQWAAELLGEEWHPAECSPAESGKLRFRPLPLRPSVDWKFSAAIRHSKSEIHMAVIHRPDLIPPDAIRRFGRNMQVIFEQIRADSAVNVASMLVRLEKCDRTLG
jgi:hypothetical protein